MGGESRWSDFVRGTKLAITFIFSHVGLCAFVAAYTVAGAFIFRELEQKFIQEHYESTPRRNQCLQAIYNITERMADVVNVTGWFEEVKEQLEKFEGELVEAVDSDLYDQSPDDQRERWNIIGSLFYCVTVITTIGYGHVSPRTDEGKMVTILYAIIGIPLMLLCLTNIGNSMAISFRFMYRQMCCWCCRSSPEEEEEPPTPASQQNNSDSGEPPPPAPYTPPPRYKPSRRNMLISPPISATIHRGSDNPFKLPSDSERASSSSKEKVSTPKPRLANPHLTLNDMEANKIVAECAAYTKTPVPGITIAPQHSQSDCHDYDMITTNNWSSEVVAPQHSPNPSVPSSPKSKDAIVDWTVPRENGGPHIIIDTHFDQSPSNSSTRPGSPALTNSTHHASSTSLGVSSSVSRPWPPSTSGTLLPLPNVNDLLDDPLPLHTGHRPPNSPGKTLVVYNTMSGDALLEQSKITRRMALMNKGGFGQARQEVTTVFTDPISGQAIDGDMLGLSYRPIPADTSDEDNRVPIPIVLIFVASYLGVGSLLFWWLEGWTLLDSGYFCFITLSTIGFGDFVPGSKSLSYETREAQIKLVTGSMYLMFGLAVLAMSFNLVQEEVVLKCKALALRIGLMKE
ncbi:hypothetical protein Pmani_033746 [Petrolisthes manimaculis]|uniref:Potassium channel domain-containing protein n=1 Tax=Petrolisthes manimaculis TaxID=1843537 RepID=A0AAE1NRA5_9EUCA|nr:hypothetical protein Pmani_033746 [Petrolisthes manimaculis]